MSVHDVDTPVVRPGAGDLPAEAFRMLVDGTAAPFVLVDRLGTIRYASGWIEPLLGWRPADLVGANIAEFLEGDQLALAIEGLAEIESSDRTGAGVPIVFAIRRPDGGQTFVEVGAMPLLDVPGLDVIALRLRAFTAEHHREEFLAQLLAGASLADSLVPLCRSIAASVDGIAAAVHHGFDGTTFVGVTGSWSGAASLPRAEDPWLAAAATGEPWWLARAGDLPTAAACWVLPVPGAEGVAPGVLTVWRDRPDAPLLGHRHVLARASRLVSLALVRTAEHERLQHLAGHDALTGVANRVSFRDRLAHALAIGERDLAVAFCDLDGFKPVNDRHGHRVGDDVLVAVADRLRQSMRVGDELARIGGDEFTVLLRNVPDAAAANQVAERLLAAFQAPFEVPGGTEPVGLSVGVALAGAGATADGLLAAADAALYACKRAGGGRAAVVG